MTHATSEAPCGHVVEDEVAECHGHTQADVKKFFFEIKSLDFNETGTSIRTLDGKKLRIIIMDLKT